METKTKEEIIRKVIFDLPHYSVRESMSDDEWYGWFEEVYDKATTSQQQTIERLREMLSNLFYLLEDEEFTYEVDLSVMDAKEEFELMKLQDPNLNTTEPIDHG